MALVSPWIACTQGTLAGAAGYGRAGLGVMRGVGGGRLQNRNCKMQNANCVHRRRVCSCPSVFNVHLRLCNLQYVDSGKAVVSFDLYSTMNAR
jgi:hypothetical protein